MVAMGTAILKFFIIIIIITIICYVVGVDSFGNSYMLSLSLDMLKDGYLPSVLHNDIKFFTHIHVCIHVVIFVD